MHGVRRNHLSPEAIAARKEKEKVEIKRYLELEKTVMDLRSERNWGEEAFRQTTTLLLRNPEYYSVWNYRRNILLNGLFPASQPSDTLNLLDDELDLTMSLLRQHPKVYWIWNHRRWCLQNMPDTPSDSDSPSDLWRKQRWDRELAIVEKMLDRDARNFHAWNYRRHVLASHPVPKSVEDELAYAEKKIKANFSNFSAWHQRSKVSADLYTSQEWKESEFDLVRSALWTDPNDQSAWLYHRWLVGSKPEDAILDREIKAIEELLEEEPNSKWCLQTLNQYLLLQDQRTGTKNIRRCQDLLSQLEGIDPLRKQRYRTMREVSALDGEA